jgi:hypothetical protein
LQEVKYGYCNTQMLETDVSKQAVKLLWPKELKPVE